MLCPVWQQLRPSAWHLSSRMISQLLDSKLITLYSSCCGSDFFFSLLEWPFSPSVDLIFLHAVYLPPFTICGLTECHICWNGIPHGIASDQGNHFTAKVSAAMGPYSCNSLVLPCFPPFWSTWLEIMVELTLKYSVTMSVRWQYFAGLWQSSPGGCMCSESVCNMWHCFSHSQDPQVQGSEGGNISGITHYDPSDPLAQQLLLIAMTLWISGLEVVVPKGGMLPPGDTIMIPLNRKLRLPPSHFGFLMPLYQQAKKGVTTLVGLTDPNHEGEIG